MKKKTPGRLMAPGALLHPVEAAGIEAAGDRSAPIRDQRQTVVFPSENGVPIRSGESMRLRPVWFFFGPLGSLTG